MVAEFAADHLAPHVERWNAAQEAAAGGRQADGRPRACSGWAVRRSTAGPATSPACASRSRRSARSTSRWASPWRRRSGWASTRIAQFGTAEQKQRWLPDLLAGHALAAFGLTEPESGSDAGATRTRAVLRDGHWVINGSKQFITNSGTDITSLITVTARTGTRDNGKPEISTLMVPTRHAGLRGRAGVRQAGLARLRHPSADLHRRGGSRRSSARRAGQGLRASSCPSSTTAGWPSPPWRWAASGPAGSSRWLRAASAPPSAGRSAASRGWRSRSPTWT